MKNLFSALSLCCAGLFLPAQVSAQSEQDFIDVFAGQWYVFDGDMRAGDDACSLVLSPERKEDVLPVITRECAVGLASSDNWKIVDGQIILFSREVETAVLGGNQFRVTGELPNSGISLVVERASGDGTSQQIAAALRKHKCYFTGFTQRCANPSDLGKPIISPETGYAFVELLVNLHTRTQPRRDAPSLGTIATGTKLKVNQCLTASDGTWCRARVGQQNIWIAMTALRQSEWPIVTFTAAITEG